MSDNTAMDNELGGKWMRQL